MNLTIGTIIILLAALAFIIYIMYDVPFEEDLFPIEKEEPSDELLADSESFEASLDQPAEYLAAPEASEPASEASPPDPEQRHL